MFEFWNYFSNDMSHRVVMFREVLFLLKQFIQQYSSQTDSDKHKIVMLAQSTNNNFEFLRIFEECMIDSIYIIYIIMLDSSTTTNF
jgi:hypothetical protein